MMKNTNNKDLAGKEFWNEAWQSRNLPPAIDPSRTELDFHVDLKFHELFANIFDKGNERRLLEVGCAGSQWLPYFAKQFGFEIEGLDYSPNGCDQARAILKRDGVKGVVHQGDLFNPSKELLQRFDVIVSFGLIEHFTDTKTIFSALSSMLKPGGTIVTMVPNISYLPGTLMRIINRDVYDAHVALTPELIHKAALACAVETVHNDYFITINLSALSLAIVKRRQSWWNKPTLRAFSAISKIVWLLNRAGLPECPNRFTSPFIIHAGTKR